LVNELTLECQRISKSFGSLKALDNVTFRLEAGKIKGLIGPNGSGKTTLINAVSGVPYGPDSGKILFGGRNIAELKPRQICMLGIARTFQAAAFFPTLTVEENVLVGSKSIGAADDAVQEALRITGLSKKKSLEARSLPIYDLKRLMIAASLGMEPKLLLVDEPLAGLSEEETLEMINILKTINESGLALLVIEHKLGKILDLCHELLVLHLGKIIADGEPRKAIASPGVVAAYFGGEAYAES
jgi:branched-chain amino acid transport system ATP-binding protein